MTHDDDESAVYTPEQFCQNSKIYFVSMAANLVSVACEEVSS